MAENKKGFLLYCDLIHTIEQLPNENAGELFKHILRYVNDLNPETDDLVTRISFEPIKQQLKRDLVKYRETSGERSEAGRLGGIKSGETRKANALLSKQNEAIALKSKQNEQDTDKDTVIDKVKVKIDNRDAVKTATLKRVLDFKNSLFPYCLPNGNYTIEMVKDFFNYWSELNKPETKMKCELQTTFQIPNRLATWAKNEKPKFEKSKSAITNLTGNEQYKQF